MSWEVILSQPNSIPYFKHQFNACWAAFAVLHEAILTTKTLAEEKKKKKLTPKSSALFHKVE